MKKITNKVVVITGSSNGIGKETALLFAKEKASVIITYKKEKEAGQETYNKCKSLGSPDPLLINLDLLDNKNIIEAVDQIINKYERVDVLINNAGVAVGKKLQDQSFEEIEKQIRTNLEGLIKITKQFLPHIQESVINVASEAGQVGYYNLSPYCGTKFGVRGFTQALADELENIKVYSVNPGMTATRMTGFRGVPPEKVAKVILNTAKGNYSVDSGGDVNAWEIISSNN